MCDQPPWLTMRHGCCSYQFYAFSSFTTFSYSTLFMFTNEHFGPRSSFSISPSLAPIDHLPNHRRVCLLISEWFYRKGGAILLLLLFFRKHCVKDKKKIPARAGDFGWAALSRGQHGIGREARLTLPVCGGMEHGALDEYEWEQWKARLEKRIRFGPVFMPFLPARKQTVASRLLHATRKEWTISNTLMDISVRQFVRQTYYEILPPCISMWKLNYSWFHNSVTNGASFCYNTESLVHDILYITAAKVCPHHVLPSLWELYLHLLLFYPYPGLLTYTAPDTRSQDLNLQSPGWCYLFWASYLSGTPSNNRLCLCMTILTWYPSGIHCD